MSRRLRFSCVPLLLSALLAAGCGGGGSDASSATDVPADGVAVSALTTQVEAGTAPDLTAVDDERTLATGDTVRTDADGLAELNFADGSLARLAGTEQLVLTELTAAAVQRTRQELTVGATWHRVKDLTAPDAAYEIETPVGVAAVRGTTFTLVCDGTPRCVLTVLEGTVEFTPLTGEPVEVGEFQRIVVTAAGVEGGPSGVSADALRDDDFTADNIERDGLEDLYDRAPQATAADLRSALNGTYTVQRTFIESEFVSSPPGTSQELTWTLALDCPAAPCSGTLTSASGTVYDMRFDGTRLTGTSNRREEVPCVDPLTGEEGGSATADGVNQLELEVIADGPESARLTGTVVQTATVVSSVPPCVDGPGTVRTSRSELTGERTS